MKHEVVKSRTDQIDLAPYGYAPGRNFFYCLDCKENFVHSGHAHSTRCATHALQLRQERQQEATARCNEASRQLDATCAAYRQQLMIMLALPAIVFGIIMTWILSSF